MNRTGRIARHTTLGSEWWGQLLLLSLHLVSVNVTHDCWLFFSIFVPEGTWPGTRCHLVACWFHFTDVFTSNGCGSFDIALYSIGGCLKLCLSSDNWSHGRLIHGFSLNLLQSLTFCTWLSCKLYQRNMIIAFTSLKERNVIISSSIALLNDDSMSTTIASKNSLGSCSQNFKTTKLSSFTTIVLSWRSTVLSGGEKRFIDLKSRKRALHQRFCGINFANTGDVVIW